MTAQISNHQPPVLSSDPPPSAVPKPPLPGGMGAAPTSVQAAEPKTWSETFKAWAEKGFVASFVGGMINIVTGFFSWIYSWFVKSPPPPQQPQSEPPGFQLPSDIQADVAVMNEFGRLPEQTQKIVYARIGKEHRGWFDRRDLETIGRQTVQENPQALRPFLPTSPLK
ncbi:MAG: hypothetical protein WCF19_05960 [Chlamydiales bacterium]